MIGLFCVLFSLFLVVDRTTFVSFFSVIVVFKCCSGERDYLARAAVGDTYFVLVVMEN